MSIGVEVIPSPEGDFEQAYLDEVGPLRVLRIGGVANARDVGGLPLADGRRVRLGRLVRSACLYDLTDEGAKTLADLGLRTVIDLRTPLEVQEEPDRIADAPGLADVTEIHVAVLRTLAELDELPQGSPRDMYRYLVDTCGPGFVTALEHLAKPDALPALVHCLVGKDRTGLVVALLLELLGVSREVILADYVASNSGLGTLLNTAVRADVLEYTLALLDDRHGGALGYLESHGITPDTVDALRAAFIE